MPYDNRHCTSSDCFREIGTNKVFDFVQVFDFARYLSLFNELQNMEPQPIRSRLKTGMPNEKSIYRQELGGESINMG